MTKRGGFRGGIKPHLPESKKRLSLSCRVAPETKVWLSNQRDKSYKSLGEWVDIAISVLQQHPDEYQRYELEYGI